MASPDCSSCSWPVRWFVAGVSVLLVGALGCADEDVQEDAGSRDGGVVRDGGTTSDRDGGTVSERDGGSVVDRDGGVVRDGGVSGRDGGGDSRDGGMSAGERFSVEFDRNATNIDGEDEVTIVCDGAPCNVGAGSFTYEVWLRGDAADNPNTSNVAKGADEASYNWINGNIFLDRDVYGGDCDGRDFGASVIDGRVSFGVGATPSGSGPLTLYGSTPIVETPAVWHHVALVHDANDGVLKIFVDGARDIESTRALPPADRSIPPGGCSQGQARSGARQSELAIGTEKHGFGTISFAGRIGRVRIWDVARTNMEIADWWQRIVPCSATGLVARYDLDEGNGSVTVDACGRSPDAVVSLGSRNLTRWVEDGPALAP